MPTVKFMPDGTAVEVQAGENLLRAAIAADVRLVASCGGDGTCGKCRLVVEEGNVEAKPSARLSGKDVEAGVVLGCLTSVLGDVVVRVPPESRPGAVPSPSTQGRRTPNVMLKADERPAHVSPEPSPLIVARALDPDPPTLSDNASDLDRVLRELRSTHGLDHVDVSLDAVRTLPHIAREGGWSLTALVTDPLLGPARIVGFKAHDTSERQLAIAVDVGTTTVEVALIDTVDDAVLASASDYNEQVTRGEDVITRVIAGSTEEGLDELRGLVMRTIGALVEKVCSQADVPHDDLLYYTVAGNTVMTHLLLGISPASIRSEPYTPVASSFPVSSAEETGLPGGEGTQVFVFPCPASWLGGDIVSGLVAAGVPWTEKLTLFVDIGTNGEIVLGSKDWLIACSCSAGPAFEGGGIRHGMRASAGAIELVRIDDETLEPMLLTIGETKPVGICGSGLIDCVSELFLAGAIDRNGKFVRTDSERIREGECGTEYVLVPSEDSSTGHDIVLSENDIENLMRAKAAVHAGISVLLESVDVRAEQIEEVVVAGGFGHYLDLEKVMVLGMFPELPAERFRFVGNASLAGARVAATSSEMLLTAHDVAQMLTYIELSVNAGFMDEYVSSLFLPHTDLALFPRTEKMLAARRATGAVG